MMQGATLQFALVVHVFTHTVAWLRWCNFCELPLCSGQAAW